ncbi:MAG TPA: alpha/beta hydrolase [Acidimicrobiales bacterium]|nr:alpha/beta hydrolase [Acidimicrobiales bacterium]
MAVTPEVQTLLDLIAAADAPPTHEQEPPAVREAFAALLAMIPKDDIASVEDRTIPGPAGPLPVRVYRSAETEDGRGLLVYFHGGGWTIGSVETHDAGCRSLAEGAGVVVVSVDYRLAPEHPFPAAVDDALAAVRWAAANAGELGADGSRLAVAGDSAGGNLAAVVSQRLRDGGPPIALQLLLYPTVDLMLSHPSIVENADGYYLTADTMRWFRRHYLGDHDPTDPLASPLRADEHVLRGLPPALVITAEYDPLRDEGEAYAEALRAAGNDVTATRFDGMIHGFLELSAFVPEGKVARDQACQALREALW